MKFDLIQKDNGKLIINSEFSELLEHNGIQTASDLWNYSGESVKNVRPERRTERIFLKQKENGMLPIEAYVKRYHPISIKEKIKAITSFHGIVKDGAKHEWDALIAFHESNLPTMIPIAVAKTANGSCNLTLGITHYMRASDIFAELYTQKGKYINARKKNLIKKIAELARVMHNLGYAHQDFYLVHIFIKPDENDSIYLIDLQRLIMQSELSNRWRIKDLAQLYYSAKPFVSKRDIFYFWKIYANSNILRNKQLIKSILSKVDKISEHDRKITKA